jgi:hypothetical protein
MGPDDIVVCFMLACLEGETVSFWLLRHANIVWNKKINSGVNGDIGTVEAA